MAPPPTYALTSAATVFGVVTSGGHGSVTVRVASMAPNHGILRGYLRRVLKNLMTLTSHYSVAFWTMN